VRLGDLADPAVVATERARLEEQGRLEAGALEYPEFLKLKVLEKRTPEQQARFDQLALIYDPPASAEKIDEAQARRDRGEEVSLDDAIMLDAAYRASIPRDRSDRRFQRQTMKLSDRVFRRVVLVRPRRVHQRRPASRRVVHSARARSPGREDPEPSPPPDVVRRGAVAK
jgi:hypothetical protein